MLNDSLFILHKKSTCSNTNRRENLESRCPGRSCRCRNNKLKRCRFVEVKNRLSLFQIVAFFRQVLSAVGVLEQERCRLSPRTLGSPHCSSGLVKTRRTINYFASKTKKPRHLGIHLTVENKTDYHWLTLMICSSSGNILI